MVEKNPVYCLDKLVEYVGNDQAVLHEMIALFIGTSKEAVDQMNQCLDEADYTAISKIAHKLKPNLDIFGIDELHEPIRELEHQSKNGGQLADLRGLVQDIQFHLDKVIGQMKFDFDQ